MYAIPSLPCLPATRFRSSFGTRCRKHRSERRRLFSASPRPYPGYLRFSLPPMKHGIQTSTAMPIKKASPHSPFFIYAEDQHLLLCPMRSNQNGGIENVHTMLRMILPKGTVFEPLTQWDIRKAVNHINSVPRGNLSGETPYRAALKNMAPIYSRPGSLHSSFQMK